MKVSELQLLNFRNFSNLHLSLGEGVNVFVGDNGQGKTNLIEAIYLLTKGQSFRPTKTDSFLKKDNHTNTQGYAGLRVLASGLESKIKMKLTESRKLYTKNDKRVSSAQLVKDFPVVLFSPESLAAIKSGPEERRILLDDWLVLLDAKQLSLINEFKKILKSRNRVLKDIKATEGSASQHKAVLASLNELYYPLAAKLTHKRILALKKLLPAFTEAMNGINSGNNVDKTVDITVDYLMSSENIMGKTESEIYEMMIKRSEQLYAAEQESGQSLVGPHKHDVKFLMFGEDSRYYCSQGQQRALILAFKMAQIIEFHKVFNDYPLLLLDDVLSELDQKKRTHLVKFLRQIDSQIFVTTTDLSFDFEQGSDKSINVFEIENGQIKPST